MKKWLATALNFFLPGLGYLIYGHKVPLAIAWLVSALSLTYVEQLHTFADGTRLLAHDPTAFGVLFAAVFIMNTAFAIDCYKVAVVAESHAS